jgi:integrase
VASAYHFAQACGKYDAHPLTGEQIKKLLNAAKGGRLEALLTLALTTGMWRGELLALHWSDIDFAERSLRVRHNVYRAGKYGIRESDPKIESSKRKIMLPQFVIDALLRHCAHQAGMRV